jgi:hypothetical protein
MMHWEQQKEQITSLRDEPSVLRRDFGGQYAIGARVQDLQKRSINLDNFFRRQCKTKTDIEKKGAISPALDKAASAARARRPGS